MGVVLDTAVLIDAERGTFDLAGYLAALGDAPVALAAVSAAELLHGVERARDAAVRQRRTSGREVRVPSVADARRGRGADTSH